MSCGVSTRRGAVKLPASRRLIRMPSVSAVPSKLPCQAATTPPLAFAASAGTPPGPMSCGAPQPVLDPYRAANTRAPECQARTKFACPVETSRGSKPSMLPDRLALPSMRAASDQPRAGVKVANQRSCGKLKPRATASSSQTTRPLPWSSTATTGRSRRCPLPMPSRGGTRRSSTGAVQWPSRACSSSCPQAGARRHSGIRETNRIRLTFLLPSLARIRRGCPVSAVHLSG